ncbi:MAG: zinc ribbon domain-containing protein [Treponema sp.]|nr:zinc ribbon domain-containing protein [Treponema sp.]
MKHPHFFCENCGAEVFKGAKSCPKCGRLFASVLCPACGFAGEEALFTGGCPVCGYSAPSENGPVPEKASPVKQETAGKLPFWVYALTGLALVAVCAALLFSVRR